MKVSARSDIRPDSLRDFVCVRVHVYERERERYRFLVETDF